MIVWVCCNEHVKLDVIVRYILIPISVPAPYFQLAPYLEVGMFNVTKGNSVRNLVLTDLFLKLTNESIFETLDVLRNASVESYV